MLYTNFYFQVHQPNRLRHLNLCNTGDGLDFFDDKLNAAIMRKVAQRCYIPTNNLLLKLLRTYEGKFKVAFSITGAALDQFRQYAPEVLDSFRALVDTGHVELLGETYYHSLSFLYDTDEFLDQVQMHRDAMEKEFGVQPTVFRNTELIYQDKLSNLIYEIEGYRTILTEGTEKVLQWRTPLYVYHNYTRDIHLLMRHYKLSDDIAFRFGDSDWEEYPLTVEKFVHWMIKLTLGEHRQRTQFLNLFIDYETFGEHQWAESGIFDFLEKLPEVVLAQPNLGFCHPSEAGSLANYQPESISFRDPVSWADLDRDLTAWLENHMQKNAVEALYNLLHRIKRRGRKDLLETVRKLTSSDHLYYMSTKYFQDGDVHKYFSPYDSPEQAYIYFTNALAALEEQLNRG